MLKWGLGGKSTDGISWRKIGTKENRTLRNIRWTWSSSFLQLASFFDSGADQNLQNQLNVKSSLDHKDLEETLTTILRNMRNWMLWFFTITWLLLDIVQYIQCNTVQYNIIYTIYTIYTHNNVQYIQVRVAVVVVYQPTHWNFCIWYFGIGT